MEAVFRSAKFWKKRVGSYRIQVNQSKSKRSDSFRGHFRMAVPQPRERKKHKKKEGDDHAGFGPLFASWVLETGKGLAGLR
jgi:hypothetical protein